MSKSVNKVLLVGNLTRDPELRYIAENKKAVCTFELATNRTMTTQRGEKREEPEFHRIVA
jgi:single-strand DNA-binding protein